MCSGVAAKRAGLLVSALVLLTALVPTDLWPQQAGRQKDLTQEEIQTLRVEIAELEGRAIIGFKPADAAKGMRPDGTPALGAGEVSRLAESLRPLGVSVRRQFRIIPAVAVTIDPDRLEDLLANPEIDYVEPDYQGELEAPIDAAAASPAQSMPWGIVRVDAAGAWSSTMGAGAKVGILDTGIDYDHPDLNPLGGINVITGGTSPGDWDDNSPLCPTHGTHVAGTVAALDNTIGVVGVAPEVDLYAVRVFDPEHSGAPGCIYYISDLIAGIDWSVSNSLDVINMSLGSSYPSIAVADALFAALTAGVLPVASIGNKGAPVVTFPGGFPYEIGVGAITESDARASFSSYGPELDVSAPGVNVLSTVGGGGYASWQGTSMAAPHVTGVAALVRAARPDLGPEDVRQILRNTADDIDASGYDIHTGWGVVQAGAAVNAVATSNLALSLVPSDITVAVEPGGNPVVTTVEVRNVGAAGTINWTAADNEMWIELSPTSGTASDGSPGYLDVTADPTGASGFFTGFVTVAGNAVNSPAQIRVRMAVAPRIPLDANVATAGLLFTGARRRYILAGSAGQAIDVAVVADKSHFQPLYDPNVRIYMPDGETLLTWNEDAPIAGLWYQALVYNVTLPADGDYIVEVGSYEDCCGGGFLVKARPAGPILGFSATHLAARGEEDASPVSLPLDVMNLSGVGTLNWTASSPNAWISIDPGSGTASFTGRRVTMDDIEMPETAVVEEDAGGEREAGERPDERLRRISEALGLPPERLSKVDLASLRPERGAQFARPVLDAEVEATTVLVTTDPTGMPLDWHYGVVVFEPADGWLSPDIPVGFFVYSNGMEIVAYNRLFPRDMTTDDTRPGDPPVIATTADDGGTLVPIASDGAVTDPVASGFTPYPGGLTLGLDANWYVGSRSFDYKILQVARDGTSSDFVTLPSTAFFIGWGPEPEGDLYASTCNIDKVWKISPDGSSYEQFGPSFDCPSGVAYRPQDNSLYVANGWGSGLKKIPLDNPSATSSIAQNVDDPWAVAVGASGTVYFTDHWGYLWSIDPDAATDATQLGLTPADIGLKGLALAEGALMVSSYNFGEFYRYPISDSPIPHPSDGGGQYVAYLDLEQIDAVQGEPFSAPLVVESGDGSNLPVAAYQCQLGWQPQELDYLENQEGDFGGTYISNDNDAAQGIFRATAARATNVNAPSTELFSLGWDFLLEPGQCTDVLIEFGELSGETGENLLPLLEVVSPVSIGLTEGMGDVTGDGNIGAADAVQILRSLVGLPLCTGCDTSRGDANCDGVIQAVDAVVILRWLVGLPVGDACVGIPRIGPCPQ